MLERNVLIDGAVYHEHRVTRLNTSVGQSTIATVTSTKLEDEGVSTNRYFTLQYRDGLKVAEAEAELWALPAFEPCDDCIETMLEDVLAMLTDEQAATIPGAFQKWAVDVAYKVGDRRRYAGTLYRCIQAHTSQADWTPDVAVSLWVRVGEPGEIPEWVQPTGAHDAYSEGDHVMHNGKEWVSTVEGEHTNTWEPGVYGWDEA